LLAKALGAEISRMPYIERSWQLVEQAHGAAPSPWLAHVSQRFPVFQGTAIPSRYRMARSHY
jgi:hypothetical protein